MGAQKVSFLLQKGHFPTIARTLYYITIIRPLLCVLPVLLPRSELVHDFSRLHPPPIYLFIFFLFPPIGSVCVHVAAPEHVRSLPHRFHFPSTIGACRSTRKQNPTMFRVLFFVGGGAVCLLPHSLLPSFFFFFGGAENAFFSGGREYFTTFPSTCCSTFFFFILSPPL